MTRIRRASIFTLVLILGAALAPTEAHAAKNDPTVVEELKKELKFTGDRMKRKKAHNDEIIEYLKSFAKVYGELDETDKATSRLRSDIRSMLIRAMRIDLVRKQGDEKVNLRSEVNVRAAKLLESLLPQLDKRERRSLAATLRKELDRLRGVKHELSADRVEAVSATYARTAGRDALAYFRKSQLRTDNADVEFTVAALKAMLLVDEISPAQRHDLFDYMRARYAGTESASQQSSTSSAVQAAKRFWDQAGTHVIAAMQMLARTPVDKNGVALRTMAQFSEWFRDHKSPKREPWVVAQKTTK